MEPKKAKELIQRQIDAIDDLRKKPFKPTIPSIRLDMGNEHKSWQYMTNGVLGKIFGKNSKQLKRFKEIVPDLKLSANWSLIFSEYLDELEAILRSFIQEIETLGFQPSGQLSTSSSDQLYDSMNIHPVIKQASESLFKSKHYSQAIFESFKAVSKLVKEKSGKDELDGQDLMAKVFNPNEPIISLNPLKTISDKDEQAGFRFLFMGAMTGIRNPKAHDPVEQKDLHKTLEYLALASLLARRVDEGKTPRDA